MGICPDLELESSVLTHSSGRGFQHVTGISFPMSKSANHGKTDCKSRNSRPELENSPILSLGLRVERCDGRDGRRLRMQGPHATGRDQLRHAQVEVGRAL